MAAEWCEHDPPILIHHKGEIEIKSRITYEGMTTQAQIDAIPAPHGHINGDGNLVIVFDNAPPFPWAFHVVVRLAGKLYARLHAGTASAPLAAGVGRRDVITLP